MTCEVIRDLLPLCADGVASEESRAAVKAHIRTCNECRALYESMCAPVEATPTEKELDYMATFAFDRIIDLKSTNVKFKMQKDFDARSYFKDSFGVLVLEDVNVERVVVRAFGNERFYLRDLPIHTSQREIAQGENYSDFELFMRPTVDFSSYVLGRSNQLKVLEPQWLANEVHQMLLDALNMYKQP